jgi:hypothetical protein
MVLYKISLIINDLTNFKRTKIQVNNYLTYMFSMKSIEQKMNEINDVWKSKYNH